MKQPVIRPESDTTYFAQRVGELRQQLAGVDPRRLAEHSGANYLQNGSQWILKLPVWGRETQLTFPELIIRDAQTGQEASLYTQAMMLYYLHTADGYPESGRWISFAELPDGRFYNQAYQGYSGAEIARFFGSKPVEFESAALKLGGERQAVGDLSFSFRPLPRLALLAVLWLGDEDFPASAQILFDDSASHYLPTDVCAILGGGLARKLIAAAPKTC